MLSQTPRAIDGPTQPSEPEPLDLEAPEYLVQRYLELSAQRRQIEDQLAFLRAELEMLAAPLLRGAGARGRFTAPRGNIHVRVQPTCVFDRGEVARFLQKEGRLADVATVTGPALARYLRDEQVLAARLGERVRYRNSVILTAG
jgi:hypothetical protein